MSARRHFGSIRKLPSGRYQASYWHKTERHTAEHTFATKVEAQSWLSSVETDIRRAAWVDPAGARMTVSELATRWTDADPGKRPNTRTRDELVIRLHIVPVLGEKKLGEVTAPDVQHVINDRAKSQAPRTVRRDYAVLRAIFAYAVASDWLVRSPCRRIKLPVVQPPKSTQLTPEDVEAIANEVGTQHAPMVWCGAVLGLRWGEVAGLRVGDLDLLKGALRVSEQRPAHGPPGPPKSSAGRRWLSLPGALVGLLANHLQTAGVTGADPNRLVFTTGDGRPIDYSNWRRRVWLPAVEELGVPDARFHDLRRTNATQLVIAGVDAKTIQTRLGHADPRLTLAVYAQAVPDADRDAAARMDERFFGRAARSRRGRPRQTGM
jgi:integrase